MNGAESLIRSFVDAGVTCCFANPGTSEMHLVQAIDAVPQMRAILTLFEGVCSGAADGYASDARSTRVDAAAPRGRAGQCGGQPAQRTPREHAPHQCGWGSRDPSRCVRRAAHVRHRRCGQAGVRLDPHGHVVDDSGRERQRRRARRDGGEPESDRQRGNVDRAGRLRVGRGPLLRAGSDPAGVRPRVPDDVIDAMAGRLNAQSVLLLDGVGLSEAGVRAAGRIAAVTGCKLFSSTFPARVESGPGLPAVTRMPYFPEQVLDTLKDVPLLMLAGAEAPVSFFAYRNLPSSLVPEGCEVACLAHRHDDIVAALEGVADALDAPRNANGHDAARPSLPQGALSTGNVARILAAMAPENCIVATDSGGGGAAYPVMQRAVRHSWLNLTGGAIGQGGPAATGAAIACPDRQVLALLGDGGAMYTIQCLWTQARERHEGGDGDLLEPRLQHSGSRVPPPRHQRHRRKPPRACSIFRGRTSTG